MIPENYRVENKIANYKMALKLNSEDYLTKLYEMIDEDTIIFYTSDHGQNLSGRTTHCSTGAETDKSEYEVPMLILTKNERINFSLNLEINSFKDKASHVDFSESVRNVMGFEVKEINSFFKSKPVTSSYCGLFGPPQKIFGMNPKCKSLLP